MEVLGYLIFAGVVGAIGFHLYSNRKNRKSSGGGSAGGGRSNPSSNRRINKH